MKCEESENYNTFTSVVRTNDDRYIFVNNFKDLEQYNRAIAERVWYVSIFFKSILFVELIFHFCYSYDNISILYYKLYHFTYNQNINLIFATYLIDIFLIFCFFIFVNFTLHIKLATRTHFKICEIFILVMLIADVIFCFIVHQKNLYFAVEEGVNFLFVRYLAFLHIELNKINLY
jgi:hypothetical protein